MSSNEETVRRAYDAYARSDMDAAHASMQPDVEIYDTRAWDRLTFPLG